MNVSLPPAGSHQRAARAAAYEGARLDVRELVPVSARRVLDLGCSSGALGAALKARQEVEVIGIEIDTAYSQDAEARLDRVVQGDVELTLASERALDELGRFDCLVAADVLEHLRDPWTALRQAVALLEPGATVVASLPNVRYWETFFQLGLRRTWPRRNSGIFDTEHLRWFTLRDAHHLLGQAGLEPRRVVTHYRLRPVGSRFDPYFRWLMSLPGLRGLFAFQYVIAAELPR